MRLPRLSPKFIFVGLVALGLPFAVAVGWTLGTPVNATPPAVSAPGGSGSLGTAPAREARTAPVDDPVGFESTTAPSTPASSSASPSATASAPAAAPSSSAAPTAGSPVVTISGLPPLTDPPVPTPTHVTDAPPSPSPTPSAAASGEPGSLSLFRER